MGQSPDSESYNIEHNGFPFYQGNADFGRIHPMVRVWCSEPKKLAKAGDILISVRAPIGALNIADCDCCIGRGLAAITPDATCADTMFLFYALYASAAELQRRGTGSTFKAISKNALSNLLLPSYCLEEQKEISAVLQQVDHLISLRQRQAEKLDELVKARFVEMFGDPVRNTKQFPLVELQDLYDVSSSKRVYQDEMVLDGIPFLRISDIVEKSTNDKCTPQCFISQEMYDQLSQKGLTPNVGDILVTSRGTLGLCYEVKPGEKFYFQDGMISWLYNRKDCVINTYLLYAFRMPGIRKQIDGSNDGSTVSYLSIARLKRLKIELPPLALQTEFSHFVHEVDRETERIQRSAALLETLKRSLMQQYFG